MALRKVIQLDNGLQVDCYIQAANVQISKAGGYSIGVNFYVWQEVGEQAQFDAIHHNNYFHPFDPDPQPQVTNVVARAYEVLKTLPEFADAVDV